jgi:hypothetical protein
LFEDGHDGDKLRGLSFLLSLKVLKAVGVVYSIAVNILLVVSLVWLPPSAFYLEVLKGFPLHKQILCCSCFVLFVSTVHISCLLKWLKPHFFQRKMVSKEMISLFYGV